MKKNNITQNYDSQLKANNSITSLANIDGNPYKHYTEHNNKINNDKRFNKR